MEMIIKRACPACNGTLSCEKFVQSDSENDVDDGKLILTEVDCRCTETDNPGYELIGVGTIDLSILDDILDKVKDIKEKLDEM